MGGGQGFSLPGWGQISMGGTNPLGNCGSVVRLSQVNENYKWPIQIHALSPYHPLSLHFIIPAGSGRMPVQKPIISEVSESVCPKGNPT